METLFRFFPRHLSLLHCNIQNRMQKKNQQASTSVWIFCVRAINEISSTQKWKEEEGANKSLNSLTMEFQTIELLETKRLSPNDQKQATKINKWEKAKKHQTTRRRAISWKTLWNYNKCSIVAESPTVTFSVVFFFSFLIQKKWQEWRKKFEIPLDSNENRLCLPSEAQPLVLAPSSHHPN